MNFEHTEDRRMLADSLNRFIAEQYSFERRDRIARSAHGFSPEIWQQFAEPLTLTCLPLRTRMFQEFVRPEFLNHLVLETPEEVSNS